MRRVHARRIMTNSKRRSSSAFNREGFDRAFLAADYLECRRMLTQLPHSDERVLLEAKIDWREQRFVEMMEPLAALTPKNKEIAVQRDILLGGAYGCTRDYSTARLRLDRALEAVPAQGELRRDALYCKALVAWMEHEHRESETLAHQALQGASPNDAARTHILISWIAARRRDLDQQVVALNRALDDLEEAPQPDEYYRGRALMALALLCRELPVDESVVHRVRKTSDAMRWTNGLALAHFQVTRYLGWVDALEGNELAAFRAFRTATALAPSPHWQVLCLTDRAYLARNTGERSFADDLLHEAHNLTQNLSWHETPREERSALFVLAELLASTAPALSQQYLAQFRSLNTSVLPGISYSEDPRIRAYAAYSNGIALLELGDTDAAAKMLSDARDIFEGHHYGWRAALCAAGLYRATNDGKWLKEATREIAPWPRSWIARDIGKLAEHASDKGLSKAQRRVLDLLVDGKSNADIAKALGRSPYTVRNHIAQLFRTYNVSNRTQLAALFNASRKA